MDSQKQKAGGHPHPSVESLPPIISMLTRPVSTVSHLIRTDPDRGVILLGMVAGITLALRASVIHGMHPLPDLMGIHPMLDDIIQLGIGASASWGLTILTIFIYGSSIGIAFLLASTLTFGFFTKVVFRKEISLRRIRTIIAWSLTPFIYLFPLWGVIGRIKFDELRLSGYAFGVVFPWEIAAPISIMMVLDILMRCLAIILFYLCARSILRLNPWQSLISILFGIFLPGALLFPHQTLGI